MKVAICLVGLVAAPGCQLVGSEVTEVDLGLPERSVTVDSADWQLSTMSRLPTIECGQDPVVCSTSLPQLCGLPDVCSGACGSDSTCEISVRVSLWNTFDLAAESTELKQIDGQPLVGVRIDRVYYSVSENSLDIVLPPLTAYVAPEGTTSLEGLQVDAIGSIPSVPAGTTIDDSDMDVTGEGKERLSDRLMDYTSPFNLIVASELTIRAGERLPRGRMVTTVKVNATGMTGL